MRRDNFVVMGFLWAVALIALFHRADVVGGELVAVLHNVVGLVVQHVQALGIPMGLLDGMGHLNAQRLNIFNDTVENGMENSGTL